MENHCNRYRLGRCTFGSRCRFHHESFVLDYILIRVPVVIDTFDNPNVTDFPTAIIGKRNRIRIRMDLTGHEQGIKVDDNDWPTIRDRVAREAKPGVTVSRVIMEYLKGNFGYRQYCHIDSPYSYFSIMKSWERAAAAASASAEQDNEGEEAASAASIVVIVEPDEEAHLRPGGSHTFPTILKSYGHIEFQDEGTFESFPRVFPVDGRHLGVIRLTAENFEWAMNEDKSGWKITRLMKRGTRHYIRERFVGGTIVAFLLRNMRHGTVDQQDHRLQIDFIDGRPERFKNVHRPQFDLIGSDMWLSDVELEMRGKRGAFKAFRREAIAQLCLSEWRPIPIPEGEALADGLSEDMLLQNPVSGVIIRLRFFYDTAHCDCFLRVVSVTNAPIVEGDIVDLLAIETTELAVHLPEGSLVSTVATETVNLPDDV